jgi:anti-sigma regulatory factor (Ser/Thr protein kinase)
VTLPPEPISAARARAFIYDRLSEHRLFYLIDRVRLVTSELVTNAIRHAETPFTVTLALTGGGVTLSVTDSSPEFPRALPFDALSDHGRGLVLVELLSADSGVHAAASGGAKAVWASFPVKKARA